MDNITQAMDIIDKAAKATRTPNGYDSIIEINGYEYDAIYQYEYIRGCKGAKGDFGQPVEPDTESEVNIYKVLIKDGTWHEVYIPDEALTDIKAEILARHED